MFLDRLGEADDGPMIEAAARRLIAGQTADGGWTYDCPLQSEETQVRRLKTLAQKRLGQNGTTQGQESGFASLQAIQNRGVWHGAADNSNTQLATLALWIARRHHVDLPRYLILQRPPHPFS